MQLTNLYVTLSSIMPKIKQTDTHFNHVPACLISFFIQFLFALPLLYQCKYTLKYNEEAQQDCCYNVGPGADQFSIGFNQSRNRTIINTPNNEPSTFPTPPVRSVPPMTAEEIASISRPVAWVVVPAMVFRQ